MSRVGQVWTWNGRFRAALMLGGGRQEGDAVYHDVVCLYTGVKLTWHESLSTPYETLDSFERVV